MMARQTSNLTLLWDTWLSTRQSYLVSPMGFKQSKTCHYIHHNLSLSFSRWLPHSPPVSFSLSHSTMSSHILSPLLSHWLPSAAPSIPLPPIFGTQVWHFDIQNASHSHGFVGCLRQKNQKSEQKYLVATK